MSMSGPPFAPQPAPHTVPLLCSFRLAKRFLLDLTDFGSCRYNLQSSAQKPTRKRMRAGRERGRGKEERKEKKLVIKWKAKWNGRRTRVQERTEEGGGGTTTCCATDPWILKWSRSRWEEWVELSARCQGCLWFPVRRRLATGDWRFLWHPHPQREIIIAIAFLFAARLLQLSSNPKIQNIYSCSIYNSVVSLWNLLKFYNLLNYI